jgi:hypothetical protein
MKPLIVAVLTAVSLSPAQGQQRFTGRIADSMCAEGGHAGMRMGPTDAECTTACVLAHGALYVLVDGKTVYALSDQKAPEAFAGQRVTVVGSLDAASRTIRVESITAAR